MEAYEGAARKLNISKHRNRSALVDKRLWFLRRGSFMSKILVLDDEPLISMLLEEWLAELGYKTMGPVETVRGALDLIGTETPSAAILDVSLQNEDCYVVAAALRDRGVRFAFATGHGSNGIAPNFRGDPILAKPFDLGGVREIISELMGNRQPAGVSCQPA
jgi:DNA-binding response OmpR family regulator